MKILKKTYFVIFAAIGIYLFIAILCKPAFAESSKTLNELLAQYHSSFGKRGSLLIIKDFKHLARGKTFHTIIAQNPGIRIEIELIKPFDENSQSNFIELKYEIIRSLYGPQRIPYPGAITDTTDCPDTKKPKEAIVEIMGETVKVLLANSSERYLLGVWDDDLIKQRAAFTVFWDRKNKTIYQIIIFQPVKKFNQKNVLGILESLRII